MPPDEAKPKPPTNPPPKARRYQRGRVRNEIFIERPLLALPRNLLLPSVAGLGHSIDRGALGKIRGIEKPFAWKQLVCVVNSPGKEEEEGGGGKRTALLTHSVAHSSFLHGLSNGDCVDGYQEQQQKRRKKKWTTERERS